MAVAVVDEVVAVVPAVVDVGVVPVVVDVGVVWREVPRSLLSLIVTKVSLWHVERKMLL